jgi:hypothetical protein
LGGGGGGSADNRPSGAGGSGIVIIRTNQAFGGPSEGSRGGYFIN